MPSSKCGHEWIAMDHETKVQSIGDGAMYREMFKCLSCGYDYIINNQHFCPSCRLTILWESEDEFHE